MDKVRHYSSSSSQTGESANSVDCVEGTIAIVDDTGIIIASTVDFCDLTGYPSAEINGKNWWADFTPAAWVEAEARTLAQLIDSEKLQFYAKELQRRDGSLLPVRILARRCEEIFFLEVIGVGQPQEGDDRGYPWNAAGLRSSESAIVAVDTDRRIRFADSRALSIFGRASIRDMRGCVIDSFFLPPSDTVLAHGGGADSAAGESTVLRILRPDGSSVEASVLSKPLVQSGRELGRVGFFKLLGGEEEKERPSRKEGSQEAAFFDSLPAAFCVIKPDGIISYVNAQARAFLGIAQEEIASGLYIFERLRPGTVGRCRSMLDETLRGADTRPAYMEVETAEGETRPAIWCMGWNRSQDAVIIMIIDAKDVLSSSLIPDEEFYVPFALTAREREVAEFLILGYEYKEIAQRMGIGLPTVRTHVQNVYAKTGVHSRAELVGLVGEYRIERYGDDGASIVARLVSSRL
jgi:PAS domain S-box